MRKLIVFNLVTLDGYFCGSNGEIEWQNADREFSEHAIKQQSAAGGLVFGRVTYQMMASYWPTPFALQNDPVIAEWMNAVPKYVVSRTLEKADWHNSTLIKSDVVDAVDQLKQQPGKDLLIFGSGNLLGTLMEHQLIDQFQLMVNPIILGSGRRLFTDIQQPLRLNLLDTKSFKNGNVLLTYQPQPTAS